MGQSCWPISVGKNWQFCIFGPTLALAYLEGIWLSLRGTKITRGSQLCQFMWGTIVGCYITMLCVHEFRDQIFAGTSLKMFFQYAQGFCPYSINAKTVCANVTTFNSCRQNPWLLIYVFAHFIKGGGGGGGA